MRLRNNDASFWMAFFSTPVRPLFFFFPNSEESEFIDGATVGIKLPPSCGLQARTSDKI
jgi:hypothetical protein